MITEIIQSEKKLEFLDYEGRQILFDYGDDLIIALLVDKALNIYKMKTKKLIKNLEIIYGNILKNWKGKINDSKPIERLIQKYFS
ncbi:MAG: hypothetical protein GF329_05835 [Candidatus Lokiarchaeota archaeon]|nr:hypothetical protein [Candidatus Lokiarchaeota archaeon]